MQGFMFIFPLLVKFSKFILIKDVDNLMENMFNLLCLWCSGTDPHSKASKDRITKHNGTFLQTARVHSVHVYVRVYYIQFVYI